MACAQQHLDPKIGEGTRQRRRIAVSVNDEHMRVEDDEYAVAQGSERSRQFVGRSRTSHEVHLPGPHPQEGWPSTDCSTQGTVCRENPRTSGLSSSRSRSCPSTLREGELTLGRSHPC